MEVLPQDAHNQALVANAHPADWTNPTPSGRYNLVAIGGGTAGIIAALGTAGLGGRAALVERHLLGGDCLNFGCVPSKALIRASRAAYEVSGADRFGVNVGDAQIDFGAVMERLRRLRSHISHHDSAERFRSLDVDVHLGDAYELSAFVQAEGIEQGRSLPVAVERWASSPAEVVLHRYSLKPFGSSPCVSRISRHRGFAEE